jgi:exo-poly-alpha-galacturonosidase
MRNKISLTILLSALLMLNLSFVVSGGAGKAVKRYVITDYGAIGDGQSLNTRAIQTAIDRCSAAGGGVVVVPTGTFLSGALFLKKGANLYVEKDGVLLGSVDPADYPQVHTRWEGVEREWTSALINADGLTNLVLSGAGTIDGNGEQWVRRTAAQRRQPNAAPGSSPAATAARVPLLGRPRLICIQNSRHVRVANLKLRNQASWGLHLLYSEDVVVEGLTIRAEHNIPSSDGIDVDSCKHVSITRCDIDVNDDCISIKSGRDADGLRVNRPSEYIVIEHCRFAYGHGGVAMGSETSGGIRHVEVRNCVAEAGNWAPVRFKSQPSRGGVVEDIVYRDIAVHDVRQVFDFNMEWRMVPPIAPPAKALPLVRNVKLINISGTANAGGIIHGLPDSPILDITFKNCKVSAQKGLIVEHARRVDFSGLDLGVKEGEPIVKKDVE